MTLYICEICGDAYIGVEKPSDCPFCGAKGTFIRLGAEAEPITEIKTEITELSKKNLMDFFLKETKFSNSNPSMMHSKKIMQ